MPFGLDGSKGGTFPSWTTATRPASPVAGQTGYNSTLGTLERYDGTAWGAVVTTASSISSGQITYGIGSTTINSSSSLFWDNANIRLGVGTSSPAGNFSVTGGPSSNSTFAVWVQNSATTPLFILRSDGYFTTGSGTFSPYNYTTGLGANVYIDSGGGLLRSTSSLKYKTDIQDATHGLADLLKLRSVTYKSKNDGEKILGGLIAEEVDAAGLCEFVQYAEDGSPDALSYGNMVALCIKSIQELSTELNAAKSRLAALEGK